MKKPNIESYYKDAVNDTSIGFNPYDYEAYAKALEEYIEFLQSANTKSHASMNLLIDIEHILTHTGEIKAHRSVHQRINELINTEPKRPDRTTDPNTTGILKGNI